MEEPKTTIIRASTSRKVFTPVKKISKIPESLLKNEKLQAAVSKLPRNYNFEIAKCIWRIQEINALRVGLQMPEGLLMFATTISDIITEFAGCETVIMGDVTYGACCVDDFTASALGVDLLIHYGHSCLIPIDRTSSIKILYVFVNIDIDVQHCIDTIKLNFEKNLKLALVSTVQFIKSLQEIKNSLISEGFLDITIPQCRPLSPGEILGCTSPNLKCSQAVIYVGDGRFHLESVMIANPKIKAYKYDPYEKKITEEFYDHSILYESRKSEIMKASEAKTFGLIVGTLGRQGSPKVYDYLKDCLHKAGKTTITILLSEIFPAKLDLFNNVDAFIQIACPRLSIDWGKCFSKPLLTPYETAFVLKLLDWNISENGENYAMDFYANESLGLWTPNHKTDNKKIDKCCGKCLK